MEGVILLKNKKSYILISQNVAFNLAPPTRFERMAFRLGGGRSIHLSYGGTDIFILSYDNWFVNLLWTWPNGT